MSSRGSRAEPCERTVRRFDRFVTPVRARQLLPQVTTPRTRCRRARPPAPFLNRVVRTPPVERVTPRVLCAFASAGSTAMACARTLSILQPLRPVRPVAHVAKMHRGDVLQGQAVGRIERQDLLERLDGVRVLASCVIGGAERVQGFDVRLGRALEQLDGSSGSTSFPRDTAPAGCGCPGSARRSSAPASSVAIACSACPDRVHA